MNRIQKTLTAIGVAMLITLGVSCGSEPAPEPGAPTSPPPASASGVELSLKVTPVTGEPLTARLIAELTGGPDNNRELYCQGQDWQFGDGMGMVTSASCMAWTPSATIQRHFEQTYTYEKPGAYEVTFTYGPLGPITTTVEVR